MKKICILVTQDSSIKNWFEPVFYIYDNSTYDVTFVTKFSPNYLQELKQKYPHFKFLNCNFPRGTSFIKTIKCISFLKKLFRKEKYDLVEYHTPNASFCASIASKKAKIKNRLYGQWGIRYVSFNGIKRLFFKMIEKHTCSCSTIVNAQSYKNLDFNVNNRVCKRNKISVLGIGGTIGVDFNQFNIDNKAEWRKEIRSKLDISDNQFVYGFIGRIHKDKGVNELIQAFAKLKNKVLIVVGDFDKNYPIDHSNEEMLLNSPNIFYINRVDRSEVAKFLSSFDVFVYPTYREGFGHVIQESLTMGIPTITSDVPGPSEVVENGISGFLVPAKHTEALADAMNLLSSNEELRLKMSKNGRLRAEKYFEKNIMVSYIINNYKEILGKWLQKKS